MNNNDCIQLRSDSSVKEILKMYDYYAAENADSDDADNIFMKVLSKYSINETCKRLGIKAFVRTVAPGEAKIYVTGKKEKIQRFEQWVKNKTPAGSIINVVKLPLVAFYVLRAIYHR